MYFRGNDNQDEAAELAAVVSPKGIGARQPDRILAARGCLTQLDLGADVQLPLQEDSAQAFSCATLTFFGFETAETFPTIAGLFRSHL